MLNERVSAALHRAGSSGDTLTVLSVRLAAAEKERDAARYFHLLMSSHIQEGQSHHLQFHFLYSYFCSNVKLKCLGQNISLLNYWNKSA